MEEKIPKRIFRIDPPEITEEEIEKIPYSHDGKHLELFYNLIFNDIKISFPDHLRPVAWALGDNNIRSMMLIISPGAGKSQLSDIAYPLWELGMDPNLTVLGISSGADLMMNFLQTTMTIIEDNPVYHLLFPHIVADKGQGWSTNRGAWIKRTVTGEPSPSYAATGYGAKSVTGKHAKILIIDDIHDAENSATSDQIEKVENFYYNTIIGRQDPQGSRMIMVGRRWVADDLYGRLKKSGDWLTMTLASIRDTEQLYYDVRIPAGLPCVFNDFQAQPEVEDLRVVYGENIDPVGFYWTGEIGKSKYKEASTVRKNKPMVFESLYQSNPEEAGSRIFDTEDFQDFTIPEYMNLGRNYDAVADFILTKHFDMIIQSWDTALTSNSLNDPSVCYTIGLKGCTANHRSKDEENQETPFHYDLYVLDENYKHIEAIDLETEAVDYFNAWNPNYVVIERSQGAIPLIQRLTSYSMPIVDIAVQHTSKLSRATNGAKAGSAQGWAKQGRIWIPRNAPWAMGMLSELKEFTGARNKQDDRVDALVQAVNWSINFGVLSKDLPFGWREDAEIDAKILSWNKNLDPFANLAHLCRNVQNPLYGCCGTCNNFKAEESFCKVHKMKVPKIGSCPMYTPDNDANATMSIIYGESSKQQ